MLFMREINGERTCSGKYRSTDAHRIMYKGAIHNRGSISFNTGSLCACLLLIISVCT
jgi:hypothetical protein